MYYIYPQSSWKLGQRVMELTNSASEILDQPAESNQ